MTDDIIKYLRLSRTRFNRHAEAADEIERLRKWASYEHAGYCSCAGSDKNCVNKAYETFRKIFDV